MPFGTLFVISAKENLSSRQDLYLVPCGIEFNLCVVSEALKKMSLLRNFDL